MSKMSKEVRVGLLFAAAIAVGACADDTDNTLIKAKVYESEMACMKDGRTASECKDGWNAALKNHKEIAPRYGSLEECRAVFERCEAREENAETPTATTQTTATTTSGEATHQSFWSPFMWGYILGQHSNDRTTHYHTPYYRNTHGTNVTGTGTAFTAGRGVAILKRDALKPTTGPAYTSPTYRGKAEGNAYNTPNHHPTNPSPFAPPPKPQAPSANNNSGQSQPTTSYRVDLPYVTRPAPQTPPKAYPDAPPSQYGKATPPPSSPATTPTQTTRPAPAAPTTTSSRGGFGSTPAPRPGGGGSVGG